MIRPVVIVGVTDLCSDPSSLGTLLWESRDDMLSVSMWLLRNRIAQFMATLKERNSRDGKKWVNVRFADFRLYRMTRFDICHVAAIYDVEQTVVKLKTFSAAKGRFYACLTWRQCAEIKEKRIAGMWTRVLQGDVNPRYIIKLTSRTREEIWACQLENFWNPDMAHNSLPLFLCLLLRRSLLKLKSPHSHWGAR